MRNGWMVNKMPDTRRGLCFLMIFLSLLSAIFLPGCSAKGADEENSDPDAVVQSGTDEEDIYAVEYLEMDEKEKAGAQKRVTGLMESCRDLYEAADKGNDSNIVLGEDVVHQMVSAASEEGLAVTCGSYDLNMTNYETVDSALRKGMEGEEAEAFFFEITTSGSFKYFGLDMKEGDLAVTYVNASFDGEMNIKIRELEKFRAYEWNYTEKGWLIWEKALSKNQEMDMHSFCRILPLDEMCRELGNQYITPVSYFSNNLFLADWDMDSMENIEFNDLYDYLFEMKYGTAPDESKYENGIPKAEFEEVIQTYFDITTEELETYAGYNPQSGTYPWEPVGPWNHVKQLQPFPEVVSCTENDDGSWTLRVEAVLKEEGTDCSFRHEVTMREKDGRWIYTGNRVERGAGGKIPGYKARREYS